jgi:uncharacterized membrane protein YfcA
METAIALGYVFVILLLGGMVKTIGGFGMGLFAAGLLSFVLPYSEVTTIVFALTALISANLMFKFRRYIVWRELLWIIAGGLLGRLAGYAFLTQFGESPWMRKLLGILIIGTVVYGIFADKLKLRITRSTPIKDWAAALLFGAVGGFIGGAFAAGGPFYVIYFLLRYENKNSYYAQLQATLFITNLFSVMLQARQHWEQSTFIYLAIGILAAWIGQTFGLKLFKRLPRVRLTQITYLLICLVGIRSLLS